MKYKVLIYCPDCSFGQDPQGCFGGGEEYIFDDEVDKLSTKPKLFNSREEAEKAGWDAVKTSIYKFEIEEE